jgi:hypothetical protein
MVGFVLILICHLSFDAVRFVSPPVSLPLSDLQPELQVTTSGGNGSPLISSEELRS